MKRPVAVSYWRACGSRLPVLVSYRAPVYDGVLAGVPLVVVFRTRVPNES